MNTTRIDIHDCPYCNGDGLKIISRADLRGTVTCQDCKGTGSVCNLCCEPILQDHECPKADDVVREKLR